MSVAIIRGLRIGDGCQDSCDNANGSAAIKDDVEDSRPGRTVVAEHGDHRAKAGDYVQDALPEEVVVFGSLETKMCVMMIVSCDGGSGDLPARVSKITGPVRVC